MLKLTGCVDYHFVKFRLISLTTFSQKPFWSHILALKPILPWRQWLWGPINTYVYICLLERFYFIIAFACRCLQKSSQILQNFNCQHNQFGLKICLVWMGMILLTKISGKGCFLEYKWFSSLPQVVYIINHFKYNTQLIMRGKKQTNKLRASFCDGGIYLVPQ